MSSDLEKTEKKLGKKIDRQYIDTVNYLDALVGLLFRKGLLHRHDLDELERAALSIDDEGHYFKSKGNLYNAAKENAESADEP